MTCLLYLLLLLSPLTSILLESVSAVFVSIDCGSSTSFYTDDNSILWVGDNLYMKNGETHDVVVPQVPGSPIVSRVMTTLRVFTTRKKNCYSIDADKGTDRILVRASFFYGNYDNKSTPPTFDLQFNGNRWARVRTVMKGVIFYEAVYSVKNTISVCVAQTLPNHLPFISALEVRSLDTGVYSHIDSIYPLFFFETLGFGTNETIRFPEDEYDRIWYPYTSLSDPSTKVTSDSPSLTIDVEDKPPKSVIQTAMTHLDLKRSLVIANDYSRINASMNINAYFSEVSKLSSTQKRSFWIYVNNKLVTNDPVIPPYGSALEIRIENVDPSANFTFALVPTSDSTLSPLINAMEMFIVGGKIADGTNSKDVSALAVLQKSFIQLQDWSGDPCLPYPYTWDWVACTFDLDAPRIKALYLNDLGLVGTLPDFSEMDALQTIDLHNNSLVQEIPDFLGSFPLLRDLNLADNNFSGAVPSSLSRNNNLNLTLSGNPNLCLSCKARPPSRNQFSSGNNKLKSTNMIPTILGTLLIIPILF